MKLPMKVGTILFASLLSIAFSSLHAKSNEDSINNEAMLANLESLKNLEKIKKSSESFTKKQKKKIQSALKESNAQNCDRTKTQAQIQKEIQKAIRSAVKEGKQVNHSVMIQKHSKACSKQSSL
jgi:cytochrome c-type biogenesis protein CcmH/NrfF